MMRHKFEIRNSKEEIRNSKFKAGSGYRSHSSLFRNSDFGFRISPSSPSGFTLIELLVAGTVTLLVAGSACVLMTKMLRASQIQADALVKQRTLHLWEDQFKQDGRLAQAAQIKAAIPETPRVEFQQPSRSVTYQVIPGGLERQVNGELAGRWECGAGTWEFSLLEGDHLLRAEFRRAEELSLSSNGRLPQGSPELPQSTRVRVDVALAVKPVQAPAPEDK